MRHWRCETGIGSVARSLALFALLIQFTLPFGMAVASDLTDHGDPTAVFDCLGGAPLQDGEEAVLIDWHHCALPGGCCIAPSLKSGGIEVVDEGEVAFSFLRADGRDRLHSRRLPNQNLVRGPPELS